MYQRLHLKKRTGKTPFCMLSELAYPQGGEASLPLSSPGGDECPRWIRSGPCGWWKDYERPGSGSSWRKATWWWTGRSLAPDTYTHREMGNRDRGWTGDVKAGLELQKVKWGDQAALAIWQHKANPPSYPPTVQPNTFNLSVFPWSLLVSAVCF